MIIEYSRNVLGLTKADHAESNPAASLKVVDQIEAAIKDALSGK